MVVHGRFPAHSPRRPSPCAKDLSMDVDKRLQQLRKVLDDDDDEEVVETEVGVG